MSLRKRNIMSLNIMFDIVYRSIYFFVSLMLFFTRQILLLDLLRHHFVSMWTSVNTGNFGSLVLTFICSSIS